MTKHLLALTFSSAILLMGSVNLNAQKVFPEFNDNPTWNVKSCFWTNCENEAVKFTKDTVINSKNYSLAIARRFRICTRNEANKVYFRCSIDDFAAEYLMYDFSATVNTIVNIAFDTPESSAIEVIPATVTSIETVTIMGTERRRFTVGGMVWIEGIGSEMHPFYSLINTNAASETSYQLLCHWQNGTQSYQNPNTSGCVTTSTPTPPANKGNEVVSDPSKNYIDVKFSEKSENYRIDIYDITGQLIKTHNNLSNQPERVYLGAKPKAGLYLVKISSTIEHDCFKVTKQ